MTPVLSRAITTSALLYLLNPVVSRAACVVDKEQHGVLISGRVTDGGLTCYVNTLLTENMPYILLIAIVLVAISGVQYMLAMGSSGEVAKARQRIAGIIGGVIFYFLITYIIRLIGGDFRI
jgi:hypothetical protein